MSAAPLSLYHIRPPFSHDNFPLRNPVAATVTNNNKPIQLHPCLALLEKCSDMSQLKQVHAQMLRTGLFFDAFTASKIVAFCALEDSGSLDYARLVLSQISNPTIFTCNSVIRGYTNRDCPREAIIFYREMIPMAWRLIGLLSLLCSSHVAICGRESSFIVTPPS